MLELLELFQQQKVGHHRVNGFLIDHDLAMFITSSIKIAYLCSNNSSSTDPLMVRAARGESIDRPPCWYALDHT